VHPERYLLQVVPEKIQDTKTQEPTLAEEGGTVTTEEVLLECLTEPERREFSLALHYGRCLWDHDIREPEPDPPAKPIKKYQLSAEKRAKKQQKKKKKKLVLKRKVEEMLDNDIIV
jgi:hypothetical protein